MFHKISQGIKRYGKEEKAVVEREEER